MDEQALPDHILTRGGGLMADVYGTMLSRIRRAMRSGARLHLDQEHVTALLDDEIYAALTKREGIELKGMEKASQTKIADLSETRVDGSTG